MNNYTDRLQREPSPAQKFMKAVGELKKPSKDDKDKATDMFDAFISEFRGEIIYTDDAKAWLKRYMSIHYEGKSEDVEILTCTCGEWHKKGTVCPNCGKQPNVQLPVIMDYTRRWMGIDILIDLAPWIMTERLTFTVSDSDRIPLMCLTLDATGYMNGRFPIDAGFKDYIQKNKHR